MSIVDRPLTPKEIFAWHQYKSTMSMHAYLNNAQNHNLQITNIASAGWNTVLDRVGSGVIDFFMIALANSAGVVREAGARVTMDGDIIYNNQSLIAVSSGLETGVDLIGKLAPDVTQTEIMGTYPGRMHFREDCRLEVYTLNLTNVAVLGAVGWYPT